MVPQIKEAPTEAASYCEGDERYLLTASLTASFKHDELERRPRRITNRRGHRHSPYGAYHMPECRKVGERHHAHSHHTNRGCCGTRGRGVFARPARSKGRARTTRSARRAGAKGRKGRSRRPGAARTSGREGRTRPLRIGWSCWFGGFNRVSCAQAGQVRYQRPLRSRMQPWRETSFSDVPWRNNSHFKN